MRTLSVDTHNSFIKNKQGSEEQNPLNESNIKSIQENINQGVPKPNNRRIINKNITRINTQNRNGDNLNSPQCESPITPFTPIQPKILFNSNNIDIILKDGANNKNKQQIISRISINKLQKDDHKLKIDDILKHMNMGQ